MHIGFRTDASLQIGSGHVMRCLTLADILRKAGAECHFVCKTYPGHLAHEIRARGHNLTLLKTGLAEPERSIVQSEFDWRTDASLTINAFSKSIDWLVVDHYRLEAQWESQLRRHVRRLLVIDDLADRSHDADLLLDQNLGRKSSEYDDLLPKDCACLIGPRYALLRPQFRIVRKYSLSRRRHPGLRHVLITFGRYDLDNASGQVLRAMQKASLHPDCRVTILLGRQAPWISSVRDQARTARWHTEVLVNEPNIAQVMAESDLCIGAGGGTSWERCCLGLPTVLIAVAENQRNGAMALAESGSAIVLADTNHIDKHLPTILDLVNTDPNTLQNLSDRSAAICDGAGTARVLAEMGIASPGKGRLRPMTEADLEMVLSWRNHPSIRANMFEQSEIAVAEHRQWFERSREDTRRHILIFELNCKPCGFVQFTNMDAQAGAEWGFYLAPDAPAGCGYKLGEAALNYAFDELGLAMIYGQSLATNERSIRFHLRLGFTEIGAGGNTTPTSRPPNVIHFKLLADHRRQSSWQG